MNSSFTLNSIQSQHVKRRSGFSGSPAPKPNNGNLKRQKTAVKGGPSSINQLLALSNMAKAGSLAAASAIAGSQNRRGSNFSGSSLGLPSVKSSITRLPPQRRGRFITQLDLQKIVFEEVAKKDEEASKQDRENALKKASIDFNFEENDLKARFPKGEGKNGKVLLAEWSGRDVISIGDPAEMRNRLYQLSNVRIWQPGLVGFLRHLSNTCKSISKNPLFENLMVLCVFINTVCLSIDHYGIDPTLAENLQIMNMIFTIVFAVEMLLKIIGIGLKSNSTFLYDRVLEG